MKTTEVTVTSTEATPTDTNGAIPLQSMDRSRSNAGFGGYAVTIAADFSHPEVGKRAGYPQSTRPTTTGQPTSTRQKNYEVNNAAWAYAKCAILFFTALLITWIPSSANRVYSFVHSDTIPTLEFMSAFVLPLQGFWNAIIYAVTSWTACKNLWSDIRHGRRPGVTEFVGGMRPTEPAYTEEIDVAHTRSQRKLKKGGESESMTELANSDRLSD